MKAVLLICVCFLEVNGFGTKFSLVDSYNDLTAEDDSHIILCDVFECAIKCVSSINCQMFSVLKQRTSCILLSKESVAFSRQAAGWKTWMKRSGIPKSPKIFSNYLHQACRNGYLNVVQMIMDRGTVDVNSRGNLGRTPVMSAAIGAQKEIFDFLVSRSCDLSSIDDYNATVLHAACSGGNVDIVKYLINSGKCDIDARGRNGSTPVLVAAGNGHTEIIKVLVSKGCSLTKTGNLKNNALHVACYRGHIEAVTFLTLTSIDIESRGQFGNTPIMCTVQHGRKAIFDLLVSRHCNVSTVNDRYLNILHIASIRGKVGMVKHILSLNAIDIESTGPHGATAVMMAAQCGHIPVIRLLMWKGCRLNVTDDNGCNILHMACMRDNPHMVKFLTTLKVLKGMQHMKDKLGRTPLEIAEIKQFSKVVSLLKVNA